MAIAAGSDLLRIGLERVVARAGLPLAAPGQPGTILLRAERPLSPAGRETAAIPLTAISRNWW